MITERPVAEKDGANIFSTLGSPYRVADRSTRGRNRVDSRDAGWTEEHVSGTKKCLQMNYLKLPR